MDAIWRGINAKKRVKMLPKINNIKDLETQINKIIYPKLIQQINKDFDLAGIDYVFDTKQIVPVFTEEFIDVIAQIVSKRFALFLNLLYRIDINEDKIRMIIQSNTDDIYKQIAFEILKREWQKVWFRLNY